MLLTNWLEGFIRRLSTTRSFRRSSRPPRRSSRLRADGYGHIETLKDRTYLSVPTLIATFPPTPPSTVNEGADVTVAWSLQGGSNSSSSISSSSATITWGDGAGGSQTSESSPFQYSYGDDSGSGEYTITLSVNYNSSGSSSSSTSSTLTASSPIKVANVPPSFTPPAAGSSGSSTSTSTSTSTTTSTPGSSIDWPDAIVLSGTQVHVSGVVYDPGSEDTLTVTIDWGDDQPADPPLTDLHPRSGFSFSHEYSAFGGYTITLSAEDDDGGKSPNETFSLNVIKLVDVNAESGGYEISEAASLPNAEKTDVIAAAKSRTEPLILVAEVKGMDPVNLPPGVTLAWTGATPIPGTMKARIDKTNPAKHTVTATLGPETFREIIYVIGAEQTGFKGSGVLSSDSFPDNSKANQSGMEPPRSNGTFQSFVQVQYTVQPAALMTDLFSTFASGTSIQFAFHRDKRILRATGQGYSPSVVFQQDSISKPNSWKKDGLNNGSGDEDVTPWGSANGHIYNNDPPGLLLGQAMPNKTAYVFADNLREWAKVIIIPADSEQKAPGGQRISYETFTWHAVRTVNKTSPTGGWVNSAPTSAKAWMNDVGPGNIFWPPLPDSIEGKMARFDPPSPVPSANVGQNFVFTVHAKPPSALPLTTIVYQISEGTLPPELTLDTNTGQITGSPTQSGSFTLTIDARPVVPPNMNDLAADAIIDLLEITITVSPQ